MQKFKEQPRLESITLSFHQRGCGVDGASLPNAALISTWPGLPQSTSPRYAAGSRGGQHDSFYSCHKERMPYDSGALPRVPRPGSTNADLCGREHAHAGYCPGNQLAFAQSVRRSRHAESGPRSCTMD
jgi:hypothetical protein